MSTPGKNQQLPKPASDMRGANNLEPVGDSFEKNAKLYKPANVGLETPKATAARVALRLIKQSTGEGFTVEELAEEIIEDNAALTFAGADPNFGSVVVGGTASDPEGDITFPELPYFDEVDGFPRCKSGDYESYYDAGTTEWNLTWFGPESRLWTSSELEETSPDGLTYVAQGDALGTPTATVLPVPATHHGQFCKASTAWWQWDGSAWIPRFTLAGDPIAYNATLSAFRKLVVSGADGSEIITISAL